MIKDTQLTIGVTSGFVKQQSGLMNKQGLVRPSSGYQGYNNVNASNNNYRGPALSSNRGNESDPESGRYSPNVSHFFFVLLSMIILQYFNQTGFQSLSSSSASSRGSLYPETMQQNLHNKIQNSIEDITCEKQTMNNRMLRPSGLKPPSVVRPTARSGLPRPTNFVKR